MKYPKSTAKDSSFLFAQYTDGRMCHISFHVANEGPLNVKISIRDAMNMLENLKRIVEVSKSEGDI